MDIKIYTKPEFSFVRNDESNRVFFTASGPVGPSVVGGITKMNRNVAGEW